MASPSSAPPHDTHDAGRRDAPWLVLAVRRDVAARSLRVALVVGTLLVAINHGDRLLAGTLAKADLRKIALTYLVPYGVSTYAAIGALRGPRRRR